MRSQSSKFTVVCFYLSWRGVISLSSQYWNLVLRTGQSFPVIIASIWHTNTCVPAIKCSKTLQTPHAPFRLDSLSLCWWLTCVPSAGNLSCSWLLLCGGVVWLGVVFSLRLQWQIECRPLPPALKTVVMCYVMHPSQTSAHSSVFSFKPLYLFVLTSTSNIQVCILIAKVLLLEQ